MQNTLFKVFLTCMLLSSCGSFNTQEFDKGSHVRDENYETIANRITKQVALRLRQEKDLRCSGTGGGMMNNVRMMAISFDFFYEVDIKEARKLLIYANTEYLKTINGSKEIRPYLINYPFTPKDIEIMIWLKEPNGNDISFGKITFLSSYDGVFIYKIATGQGSYSSEKIHQETYEEALKIVEAEELANQTKAS